jgi:predicted GH43/DUF377 family glycosyl hydrolase
MTKFILAVLIAAAPVAAVQAPSWALLPFTKADKDNPVLTPGSGAFMDPIRRQRVLWEEKDVFNPATVVRGDSVFLLYRAQDKVGHPAGTSRIGLARSADGYHFTRDAAPVLYPDNDSQKKYEWEGGCEDPRVVEDEKGVCYMTYTAFDGKLARLLVATSTDLRHWKKHGPVFAKAQNGRYIDKWSKSGSIVSTYKNGRVVATRIRGKYWMYWGDTNIWVASSDNLIDWTPVEKPVIAPRAKLFDSDLVESGPPAMLTDKGILLLYNSRNIPAKGDPGLPEGTYTASQILLDKNDPTHILQRMDNYFLRPDKPYELNGQVNAVCFVEGLAEFHRQWFLYYGTADSKIAVATRPVDK